ncbi:FadR/GntR family transcriptional regulator [Paenibacillus sp. MMS18-CY102]|uniref:FadR/GntR family transcriptional regulator n=1 Tax=Paenibacillus sp. MMS18-CY102 TaxID=2682849 RepID=UPI0013655803|nr:FadR/GntR family transcriptional regulator [Paenibacillus sp. MMS18-CY102]MWC29269.1 FCD domain-containing protein [Paenibacillus sp. MMS18-CY102]
MDVAKLDKRNHYEEIAEQIRTLIESGKLKVGDKLPSTKEMSERFGVGRSTMREALSGLKAMGLIEIRQGGGCTVVRTQPLAESSGLTPTPTLLDGTSLLELLEARQSLEVSYAAIAASKRSESDVEQLRLIIAHMVEAAGDEEAGEKLDVAFHQAIAHATGNSVMMRLFETIMQQTETAIRAVRRIEMYTNKSVADQLLCEHNIICEAIAAGDGELAASAMQEHLQHVARIVSKHTA